MSEHNDPVTSLIEALNKKAAATAAPTPAEPTDRLADAAGSIPGRSDTAVTDLLDSPELQAFRRAYVTGVVEAHLINRVLDLVKTVLAARGII